MKLHKTQKEVNLSKAKYKVLNCGRGWGKTSYAIETILFKAVQKGGLKVAYIAPTIQQAKDIVFQNLTKRAESLITHKTSQPPEVTVRTKDGGTSQIIIRGWEAIETLRGMEFDYIVIDEVASMRNFWVGMEEVLRPTLRMSEGDMLFISTPKGFNHWYDLYNTQDPDWESFHYTSYDNPFLSEEWIEKEKAQMPIDTFQQEYMADFKKMEGLVFKEFARAVHVFDDPYDIDEAEYIAGLDWGYNDPTAISFIKKDRRGTYWIYDEYYKTGQTDAAVAEFTASQNFQKVYPDPANPAGIKELQDRHVNVMEVKKGPGSIEGGISKVRELLKQRRIRVHKSCINLINEFETYAYDVNAKDSKGKKVDVPEDKNNHLLDGLRYVIMMNTSTNQMKNAWIPLAESNTNNRKGRI